MPASQLAQLPAERIVHRLHRHADRAERRQQASHLPRVGRGLRNPASGDRQGHGAGLLRTPHRQHEPERSGIAQGRFRVSRWIYVDLCNELIKVRPNWASAQCHFLWQICHL